MEMRNDDFFKSCLCPKDISDAKLQIGSKKVKARPEAFQRRGQYWQPSTFFACKKWVFQYCFRLFNLDFSRTYLWALHRK